VEEGGGRGHVDLEGSRGRVTRGRAMRLLACRKVWPQLGSLELLERVLEVVLLLVG